MVGGLNDPEGWDADWTIRLGQGLQQFAGGVIVGEVLPRAERFFGRRGPEFTNPP